MATRRQLLKTGLIMMGSSVVLFLIGVELGYRTMSRPDTLQAYLAVIAVIGPIFGFPLGIIILVVALTKLNFPSRFEVHTKFTPDFDKLRQQIQSVENEEVDIQQVPHSRESNPE